MKNIVNTKRHRKSTAEHATLLASTQSDRARLMYSASFRRLQQKAQVFSLESNSAVRSRLTHSLEVSHIGRYIVASISEKIEGASGIDQEQKDYWKNNGIALSNIVETSCLMHDIGNPPFGHFGEAAISKWANSKEAIDTFSASLGTRSKEYQKALNDFIFFDGNPQGFRIVTKLQGEDGFYGLNLTYAQLAAFLKYTYSPATVNDNKNKPFTKKVGYFDTEIDVIESAWAALGMKPNTRHPLGFLMEASDDISYCISDIEDGIEKGIISIDHFKANVISGLEKVGLNHGSPQICRDLSDILCSDKQAPVGQFLSFKTKLSNYLVDRVAQSFVDQYNNLINMSVSKEIISKGTLEYDLLKILKVYTSDYLFTSAEAECMELSGYSIISGIISDYQKLLELPLEKFKSLIINDFESIKENDLHIHRRLFNRLPEKHLNAYKAAILKNSLPNVLKELDVETTLNDSLVEQLDQYDKVQEWNLRAHLVIDFISGMTDQFSMEFFHMLKGINV